VFGKHGQAFIHQRGGTVQIEAIALPDEIGKTCIHCGTTINKDDKVHRYGDGEAVHKNCYDLLNDEDAHFYEAPGEELP
jgi:hypothetical protein